MSSTITALTSGGGLAMAGDTSGQLEFKSDTTKLGLVGTGTNTVFGNQALNVNSGTGNTAFGYQAGTSNTTGNNMVAVGYQAGLSNTTGAITAIGAYALYANTTGSGNTAVGGFDGTNSSALRFNTTGYSNTATGTAALAANTTGYQNTSVGYQCLNNVTTGIRNTGIGVSSGTGIGTGSNNTVIGYDASVTGGAADNQIILGSGLTAAGDNYFSFGKAGNVVFNQFTSNASWTRISDGRLKTNVANDNLGLEFINKLRPVTHKWKPSNEVPQELTRHYNAENQMDTDVVLNGFIAQEVKQALEDCGSPVFGGWMEMDDGSQAISREMFIFPLINAIKELNEKLETQATTIAAQEARLVALEAKALVG